MVKPIFCMHSFNISMSPMFLWSCWNAAGQNRGQENLKWWCIKKWFAWLLELNFFPLFMTAAFRLLWTLVFIYLEISQWFQKLKFAIVSVAVLVSSICDEWEEGSKFSETYQQWSTHYPQVWLPEQGFLLNSFEGMSKCISDCVCFKCCVPLWPPADSCLFRGEGESCFEKSEMEIPTWTSVVELLMLLFKIVL